MSIRRGPRPDTFFQVALSNLGAAQDLSWDAMGVLFYAASHADQPFTLENMRNWPSPKPMGRDLAKRIMNELITGGYVSMEGETAFYIKAKIPEELRQQVLERDGHRCVECESVKRLSVDHIIPERFGGETVLENLQAMCRPCNSEKGTKMPMEEL